MASFKPLSTSFFSPYGRDQPDFGAFRGIDQAIVAHDQIVSIQAFGQREILVGRKFTTMENWLRVSMGTPEEMQKFVAALREIVPAKAS